MSDNFLVERKRRSDDFFLRIAQAVFIDTAHDDYIQARIASNYGFQRQFWWSASQCLEKLTKVHLVFADIDTTSIHHDFAAPLKSYNSIASINLPDRMIFPKKLTADFNATKYRRKRIVDFDTFGFIGKVQKLGRSSVRYGLNRVSLDPLDLPSFDAIVSHFDKMLRIEVNISQFGQSGFENKRKTLLEHRISELDTNLSMTLADHVRCLNYSMYNEPIVEKISWKFGFSASERDFPLDDCDFKDAFLRFSRLAKV